MGKTEKNSLIIYYELYDNLEDLSDREFGLLIRAAIKYDRDGEVPDFIGKMKISFNFIKNSLDINKIKYFDRKEKNKIAAEIRWDKVKNPNENDIF